MSDQYLGEIRLFSGSYAPQNWAFCDGQTLTISQNQALFAVIGNVFGGDGVSNFKLPDLRGRVGMHLGKSPVSQNTYALGQNGGVENVTLLTANLPVHTHSVMCQNQSGSSSVPNSNYWAQSNTQQYSDKPAGGVMANAALTSAGNSIPHDNMMPYLTLSYIIALQGIFPSPQ